MRDVLSAHASCPWLHSFHTMSQVFICDFFFHNFCRIIIFIFARAEPERRLCRLQLISLFFHETNALKSHNTTDNWNGVFRNFIAGCWNDKLRDELKVCLARICVSHTPLWPSIRCHRFMCINEIIRMHLLCASTSSYTISIFTTNRFVMFIAKFKCFNWKFINHKILFSVFFFAVSKCGKAYGKLTIKIGGHTAHTHILSKIIIIY